MHCEGTCNVLICYTYGYNPLSLTLHTTHIEREQDDISYRYTSSSNLGSF